MVENELIMDWTNGGGKCMAQAEHDALLKKKGNLRNQKLNWDDYQTMKFTQCVCNLLRSLQRVDLSFT